MASYWDWLPAVITGGATLLGTKMTTDANKAATSTANAGTDAATKAQLESLNRAELILKQQQTAASPGLMRMQQMVGAGDQLTPSQITALEDARRTSLDALKGGSLRGSARATADTVRKVEGDMRNQFLESNRNRSDSAATNLSNQYFSSGNAVANNAVNAGNAVSSGLVSTAGNNANLTTTNSQIQGKAIGDIGAIIADQLKADNQKKRDSSYAPVGQNIFNESTGAWSQA